jgi:hypothetical protein
MAGASNHSVLDYLIVEQLKSNILMERCNKSMPLVETKGAFPFPQIEIPEKHHIVRRRLDK